MFKKREINKKIAGSFTLLLGGPGSGKSEVSKYLPLTALSIGKILRKHSMDANDSLLQKTLDAGQLLNDKQLIPLIEPYLRGHQPLLLDGFPRTSVQWNYFKQAYSCFPAVIYLSASPQTMQNNGLARGRSDDTLPVILARIQHFESQILPLINEIIKECPHHLVLDANNSSPEELADLAAQYLIKHEILSEEAVNPVYNI